MFISIIFSAASCKTSKTCLCTLLRDFLPLSGLHKGKRRGKDNVISIAPILVKPLRRSGMDHTVLSANNIMPACTDGATTDCDRRLTNCSLLHCSGKRWKIPPIKVVQNLHQHGGKIPPSAWRWKNSTMPHPPFLVEFFHLFADGGKVVANSTYKGGPKSPPTWWNFSTINTGVEKFHHATSTFLGGIFPPACRWWKNSNK